MVLENRTPACRECTHPRAIQILEFMSQSQDELSLDQSFKFTSQFLGTHGNVIHIPSTTTPNRNSWVVICRGKNRCVDESHLNDPDHNPTNWKDLLQERERKPGSTKMERSSIEEIHAKQLKIQTNPVCDVVRRLVTRTMSQHLSPAVERATSPLVRHDNTGRMRARGARAAEIDPEVKVTSIDGLGAYDMISRGAMLRGLVSVSGAALPFTRMFYGRSSEYLWEKDNGEVHRIPQGEGGEQGDPMMPFLYSLGQHGALEAANDRLTRGERLLAFLDDTFIVTPTAAEAGTAHGHVRLALRNHCGIHVHVGKTKIWIWAGNRLRICDMLERIAQTTGQGVEGSQVPTAEQGMKVLGTPLGHEDCVARHLEAVVDEPRVLLERIPRVQDVQSAWLLRLHCASARATCQLTLILLRSTTQVCGDACVPFCNWIRCSLTASEKLPQCQCFENVHASILVELGGLFGDDSQAPIGSARLVHHLEGHPNTPSCQAAAGAARSLRGVQGFEPPSSEALAHGGRPVPRQPDDFEPGCERGGWQREAASRREPL